MKALQGSFEGLFQVSYHALVKETKHRTGVEGLISHKTFRGGYFQGKIGSVTKLASHKISLKLWVILPSW